MFYFLTLLQMAHFNFAKDISELVKMDGPMQKSTLMRWERKAQEAGNYSVKLFPLQC